MSQDKLRGVFTPNMVPLSDDGQINEPELRRYIDWLIDRGVHGLYPNGSTGEFLRFTPEERRRVIEIVADQAGGRVPILAGAAEANVRETLKACEHYAQLGCRAAAIISPIYYRLGPDAVFAYYREIGRNAPLDITLYNFPNLASPIDVPTVQRLSEVCPRIVGIKDSSGDLAHLMRLMQAVRPNRPDFAFLTGWDPTLMASLMMGADGGTHLSSGVAPELTKAVYELTTAGRLDAARRLQYQLLTLFDALLFSAEFPAGVRAGLELQGFKMGISRQPTAEGVTVDVERICAALATLETASTPTAA